MEITKNAPIAVFDSGMGGLSVLRRLMQEMPREDFLYFGDSANAPYGSRPTEEIRDLSLKHGERLLAEGAKALVVACNTATAAAIDELRRRYPHRIIIGIEPALKPAADRFPGGTVLVMATDATLREQKFAALLERYAQNVHILKCPCPGLVELVEQGQLEGEKVETSLKKLLSPHLAQRPQAVVLGCTHYPFLKKSIVKIVGEDTEIFDGADGTARECRRRLAEADLLRSEGEGKLRLTNSCPDPEMKTRAEFLLSRK
ncbi:MAG: glutamate racemase [Oscillospiraceae bacterium]|nr:glutamate racemase [Oscillospiraceae bacterium]